MTSMIAHNEHIQEDRCITDDDFQSMAWGYNSFFMESNKDEVHHIEFEGDLQGSSGSDAKFELKYAIVTDDDILYETIIYNPLKIMERDIALKEGQVVILIVTAMPKIFSTDEVFNYHIKITSLAC